MDQAGELVRYCEGWWQQSEPRSEGELGPAAEKFVTCLGWETWKVADEPLADVSLLMIGAEKSRLAVHFVGPGKLLPPGKLAEQAVDFSPIALQLVRATQDKDIRHVLITDLYRSFLYEVDAEELLACSDTPRTFLTSLYDEVTKECVDEGALGELRRAPRSVLARQLREWCTRWSEKVAQGSKEGEAAMDRLLDGLFIARFLHDHNILGDSGADLANRLSRIFEAGAYRNDIAIGPEIAALFRALSVEFGADAFSMNTAMEALLGQTVLVEPMLKSFALLSKAKFSIPVVLESFNFGEAAEKARVRIVPQENEERENYLDAQTVASIGEARLEIDVLEEGYRVIGHCFDRLVSVYDEMRNEADANAQEGVTPDSAKGWRDEPLRYAAEQGLRVYHASPRQYRTARLFFYLHLIQAHAQRGAVMRYFANINLAFVERPALLDSEKPWLHDGAAEKNSRGWDVVQ